jgi:hypothetical protein
MKTNQIMIRYSETITITQRTIDGMFNINQICDSYNKHNPDKVKYITHYWDNKSTKEFIETIMRRENHNTRNSVYLTSRGKNGGTWVHPLLFIDFMMWLSPDFKYDALKIVQDKLIQNRIISGDQYKEMTPSIDRWYRRNNNNKETPKEIYAQFATLIKLVIFNKNHQHSIWQKCGEDKLDLRYKLEKVIANCCDKDMTMDDIMKQLVFFKQLGI